MTITSSLRNFFFDRARTRELVDAVAVKRLSSLGAYVRTAARSLLRPRKLASTPGSPPSVHSKSDTATLRNVQFGYDPARRSLVVGPLALNWYGLANTNAPDDVKGPLSWRTLRRGVVPRVLEHGGYVGIREIQFSDGSWKRISITKQLGTRRIPIWKATDIEKKRAIRQEVFHSGKRGITYLIVPVEADTRLRWAKIAPRPFMGPAADKGYADWRRKVMNDDGSRRAA